MGSNMEVTKDNLLIIDGKIEAFGDEAKNKALKKNIEIDYQIESKGSPDKKKFMEVARKEGIRKAIKFRDIRFSIDE